MHIDLRRVALPLSLTAIIVGAFALGANKEAFLHVITNPSSFLSALSASRAETISAKELAALLKKKNLTALPSGRQAARQGFTFINVHTPYEGEIAGTDTFIPYNEMVANSASLPKDKNAPIIIYCKSGRMSAEALPVLKKLGYTNVRHLAGGMDAWKKAGQTLLDLSKLEETVLPQNGATLSVSWGDLGPQLIRAGVIDLAKFREAVKLTPDMEKILTQGTDEKIKIDAGNSQFVVDLLWAVGLAQKSAVYDQGPMGKEYKKDIGNFASTGGWTLARGDATAYINRFDLIPLTADQQAKVGEIAKNVYRPCCGNSTWFPDCNHGMAALAAIELMVAAGMNEKDIYKEVLALNSFFFPDNYLTVATYFARQGTPWEKVDAKEVLGATYSSGQGAGAISKKVGPLPYKPQQGGGACGA